MKKFVFTIICLCLVLPVAAQISPLLQKGKSGGLITLGVDKEEVSWGPTVRIGTSINGIIDFELNYLHSQADEEKIHTTSEDVSANFYEAVVTWWFLRSQPTDRFDVNLGLSPGYGWGTYDDYLFQDGSQSGEYKGYYLGQLGLQSNVVFHLDRNWIFEPFFNVDYEVGHDKVNDNIFNFHGFTSSLGITFGKRMKNGSALFMSLKQSSGSYGAGEYFDAEVGYVFPW